MEPLFLQTIANHEFHITNSYRSFYLFPFQEGYSALQQTNLQRNSARTFLSQIKSLPGLIK